MNTDQCSVDPQGDPGEPRARACRASPSKEASTAATASQDELVVRPSDMEAIAASIETGAPAKNETVGSIIASHPEVRRAIVAAAVRALGAKKWWYDAKKKRRIEEPDYALSFKAAEFLADRVDGRPAQAVMNLNLNAQASAPEKRNDFEVMLRASPATREAMRRLLDRADREATKDVSGRSAI